MLEERFTLRALRLLNKFNLLKSDVKPTVWGMEK
jgi:hypothetical protein